MSDGPSILLVDDDEGHAILIREHLESVGWRNRIEHLSDGQAALDYFGRRAGRRAETVGDRFLVLLDIRMPKVDGIEVLRRLKSDPALRRIPVIMLTTTDDAREVARCYDLGCNAYLQKPVDYEKFSETIRRLGQFLALLVVPRTGRAGLPE
jgi:CheY-like chemotaxis protein